MATDTKTQPSGEVSKTSFLATRWVQLLLGLSVTVVVGLLPYLGKFIPLLAPLMSILPEAIQPLAVPLAAASMGIVAVIVQWRIGHKLPVEQLNLWFRQTIVACAVSLAVLAALETIMVVRVDVPAANRTVSFAIGPSHPNVPPCVGLSRADCIKHQLSLDEASIDSYFGEGWVNATKFVLVVVYTIFMSTFGALAVMLAWQMKLKFTRSSEAAT